MIRYDIKIMITAINGTVIIFFPSVSELGLTGGFSLLDFIKYTRTKEKSIPKVRADIPTLIIESILI